MGDQALHIRSTSLPSRSHPAAAQIEEHLCKIRACLGSLTTSAVSDCLRGLGDVYDAIEQLLRLPYNQQHLAHSNQRKWLEEELDLSLRILDLSGAIRDGLAFTRSHLRETQLSVRRKACTDVKSKTAHHHDSTPLRSIKKSFTISMRSLQKQMENSNKRTPCSAIDAMMVETREILIALLQAASSFLAMPRINQKGRTRKWSLMCQFLHTKKVVCEEKELGTGGEFMDALCDNLYDLECGLESLFRKLIKNRVSLLNILSF